MLRDQSGKAFDPAIVARFTELLPVLTPPANDGFTRRTPASDRTDEHATVERGERLRADAFAKIALANRENNALYEIANRHYNGKIRKLETYQIILMADGSIPYATIASTMAAMRCKLAEFDKEPKPCAIPTEDPDSLKRLRDHKIGVSPDNTVLDPETAAYDPKKMALFSTILFSSGFE